MTLLPKPEHWRDRSLMLAFAILLFGASAVAAAVMTLDRVQRGEYLTAAITFGGSVFAVCATLAVVRGRFMTLPLRSRPDPLGTVLLPDLVALWLVGMLSAAAIPSGLLFVIFVPRGVVDLPMSPGQRIFSPILIGLLVVFAAGGLIAMTIRRGGGHLRLTPDGFENVELHGSRKGTWNDVTDIVDQASDKSVRHPIVFVMSNGKPIVIKNASGYAPSGAALYWMVRHYWLHPENRDELIDGRALDRLRNEQFEPE